MKTIRALCITFCTIGLFYLLIGGAAVLPFVLMGIGILFAAIAVKKAPC